MSFRRLLGLGAIALVLTCQKNLIFADSSQIIRTFTTGANGDSITALATLSPDGSKLAIHVYSRDSHIQHLTVYDIDSGKKLYEASTAELMGSVQIEAFSSDGNRIAVARTHLSGKKELSIIQLSSGESIYDSAHYGVEKSHFLLDGKLLDVSSDNLGLVVIDLNKKHPTSVLHPSRLVGILISDCFSDDDQLAFVPGASTATATIVNLQNSRMVSTIKLPDQAWQLATIFLPHTHILRGVDGQGIIRTWDADTGKLVSQLEPKHLIYLQQATFTSDGKQLVTEIANGLQFIDAQTYKTIGYWQGPNGCEAKIDTFHSGRVVVDMNRRGATFAVMRVIPQAHFRPPTLPSGVAFRVLELSPSVSAAATIPPHTAKDLRNADWWLKCAGAEYATTNQMVRDEISSQLAVDYAAAGDDASAQRLVQSVAARFANAANQFWSPVIELRQEVAGYQVQHMVASGHTADAIALAKSLTTTRPPNDSVWRELVVAQARSGDINGAIQSLKQLSNKDSQGRTGVSTARLLADTGKFSDAEQIADAIPDPYWKGEARIRIAEGKAKKDDVDGAIAEIDKISNMGGHELDKIVNILAALPDDAGAQKFIESLPAPQNAWGWLQSDQLKRGDIAAAKTTEQRLIDIGTDLFNGEIAETEIRIGQVNQAIADAKADKVDDEMVQHVLNALVKYNHPDALLDLLAHLPPARDTDYDYASLRNNYYLQAAIILAQDNRLADAQRIFAKAHPQKDREDSDDGLYTDAQWEIAGAMRRTGDHPGYQKALQPFFAAISSATGAPSRAEAQSNLFAFYMTVGDYTAAESLAKQMDPELSRNVAMSIAMMLNPHPQPDEHEPKPDPARTKALLQMAADTMPRPVPGIMTKPAQESLNTHTEEQWLQWAHTLPTVQGRISAYLAMAQVLLPPDPLADPQQ
ncbi:MAG TPA: hypothetical protein VGG19_12770 [Tepidisphaeraceae bacterium]|jgi:tetratricopeptide (TPR) repeat protein